MHALGLLLLLAAPVVVPPELAGKWVVLPEHAVDPEAAVADSAGNAQLESGKGQTLFLVPRSSWTGEVERVELRQRMIEVLAETNTIELELAPGEVHFNAGEITRILYLDREQVRDDARGVRLKCRTSVREGRLVVVQEWPDGMRITETYLALPEPAGMLASLRWESKYLKKPFELDRRYRRAD